MPKQKLPKLTLSKSKEKKGWELKDDKTKKVIHTFRKKENATKGGVLERIVGPKGASVKIKKMSGEYQEERTYPGSRDPSSSKG